MWNSLNSNLWVCVLVEARRETVVFSLFPFYANTCSFLINSFACSEWHDAGGDGSASKDAAVDFVPCVEGWRMAGLLCQVFILWPLLSHSRLTWAFGANWLLIAWAFSMLQKRAHFKGNQFNEIIYQGLSRHLNTHTPPPLLSMQSSLPGRLHTKPSGESYLQKECMLSSSLWVYIEFPTHCCACLWWKV